MPELTPHACEACRAAAPRTVKDWKRVRQFLSDHSYLGPLPLWQHAAVVERDGEWVGLVVVSIPVAGPYARKPYREVRRLALAPGACEGTARELMLEAVRWSREGGYERLIAYSDPEAPSGAGNCPGNEAGGALYASVGMRLDGWTHSTGRRARWAIDLKGPTDGPRPPAPG